MTAPIVFRRIGTSDQFPISLEAARDHLRVDFDDDDQRIKNLIKSVCAEAQHFTGKPIFQTLWQSSPLKIGTAITVDLPFVQRAAVSANGTLTPSSLTKNDSQSTLNIPTPPVTDAVIDVAQQYVSDDLELTLLLQVAFYYERRDLTRFSEATMNTLRKRLIYHRDAIVSSSQ